MTHAIVIMAHKDYPMLRRLVDYFYQDCLVFIHIDIGGSITNDEIKQLEAVSQVAAVYRKYRIHWAGFSILKCEMFLLREIQRSYDFDYIHLISGQDYPIRPLSEFLRFFKDSDEKDYMSYTHLPSLKWEQNTFTRFNTIIHMIGLKTERKLDCAFASGFIFK